ncbi:MAG: hypothetical protein ABR503_11485 [Chitinophagaceae bacterium]
MALTKSTYYKALVLLIVFSLNTVVSFACSFSNLFHGFHHHKSSATTVEHKHSGSHHDSHDQKNKHDHGIQAEHKHDSGSSKNAKDDCCSASLVEIEKVEKALSRTIEAPHVIFVTSLFTVYTKLFSLPTIEKVFHPDNIRWRFPATIQDIRIAIQSLQI